ncbi:hypothetical protein WJX72_011951 [[Myrmecia] bisecta]|uniref:Uncharacterized protein n=1 Tax=[Myrmecia] bisecta TaxID=41462 RepID=A0AAW1RB80_9CHLO
METQLTFDNQRRSLGLFFKEKFVTDSNLMLKVKGVIDTKTGQIDYAGSLRKFFYSKTPPTPGQRIVVADRKRVKVGAGLSYISGTEDVLCGLTVKKQFQLGEGENWATFKAQADYNTQTQKMVGLGRAQFSKAIYNFTDTQDLRLRLGYKAHVTQEGVVTGEPYGQLRENNWSLNTDFKGHWSVRYDL